MASVGMVEAGGHCSPAAHLAQEERPGAPVFAEKVSVGQARHVEGLVAFSVAL